MIFLRPLEQIVNFVSFTKYFCYDKVYKVQNTNFREISTPIYVTYKQCYYSPRKLEELEIFTSRGMDLQYYHSR